MAGEACLLLDMTAVRSSSKTLQKLTRYKPNYCCLYIALHLLLYLDLKPEILKMKKKATLQTWLTNKKKFASIKGNLKKKKKKVGGGMSDCC